MKALVLEDDPKISRFVAQILREEGYAVEDRRIWEEKSAVEDRWLWEEGSAVEGRLVVFTGAARGNPK